MMQTWAMIVDAYRELNARKLFWITMVLSALVTAVIGCLGISEKGLTLLWFEFPFEIFNTSIIERATFYKFLFLTFGMGVWLTWAATILALISTANLMPDFVSSGSIELTLSKPISRLRLFLTKYATGLLFVELQVSVFTLAAFVVIGVRAGSWEVGLFWAVPLVVIFFSYLYCVTTLAGLLTRSGMAALLVTVLLWIVIFVVHLAETGILLQMRTQYDIAVSLHKTEVEKRTVQLADARKAAEAAGDPPVPSLAETKNDPPAANGAKDETKPVGQPPAKPDAKPDAKPESKPESKTESKSEAPWSTMDDLNKTDPVTVRANNIRRLERELEDVKAKQRDTEATAQTLNNYHAITFAVKSILPKTSETMELLQRNLFKGDEFERFQDESADRGRGPGRMMTPVGAVRVSQRQVTTEVQKMVRTRSVWWVLGTSLAFEAVVLGAACVIFCRRDF
jgi:ABC-type transport system involved in multi-copper enzyme maturation permease subunit